MNSFNYADNFIPFFTEAYIVYLAMKLINIRLPVKYCHSLSLTCKDILCLVLLLFPYFPYCRMTALVVGNKLLYFSRFNYNMCRRKDAQNRFGRCSQRNAHEWVKPQQCRCPSTTFNGHGMICLLTETNLVTFLSIMRNICCVFLLTCISTLIRFEVALWTAV